MSKNLPTIAQNTPSRSVNITDHEVQEIQVSNRIVYEFFAGHCFHILKGAVNKEPLFRAAQVAEILGYADPDQAIHQHCKNVQKLPDESGDKKRWVLIIGEADLYRLIIRSNKPEAQEFERWVMEVVLPNLRKSKHDRKLHPNEEGKAIIEDAKAKQAQQMELFPEKLVLRFPEEPVNKLREARARLAEYGTTFESHEDFIGYVIEKGLEAL